MPTVNNGQIYANIRDLPEIDEINNGDYMIVETENGTHILNFTNFVIDTSNAAFYSTVADNTQSIINLNSSQKVTTTNLGNVVNLLNRFVTVEYRVSAGSAGFEFSTASAPLPLSHIQSNSIDGNIASVSSTKVSLASNILSLNPGTYQVAVKGAASGSFLMELYNSTNSTILLRSEYSSTPAIIGMIVLTSRSELIIRGSANASRTLGVTTPFSGNQIPLAATFQLLSSGAYPTS